MSEVFPEKITNLPIADVPFEGVNAHLFQGDKSQIIFMEFKKDTIVPEHSHNSQWEIVLEGMVDYFQDGKKHTYKKGDRFFVPEGKKHSALVYAGYAAIAYFDQKDRYKIKK